MAEVQGSTAPVSAPVEPNPNMTGEEAVRWVESQKNKPRDEKFDDARRSEPSAVKADTVTKDTIKEAAAEAKRKFKIDDEEVDEEEVLKTYKLRRDHQKAANKILQEGKAAHQQALEFINMMKDPEKFYEVAAKLGHDPRKLAELRIAKELEDELMDPKDKEIRRLKNLEKQVEAERQAKAKEAEEAHVKTLKDKYAKEYSDQFVAAMQETGVPSTKQTVARMARYIQDAAKDGYKMDAKDAALLVKEDLILEQKSVLSEADGAALVKMFGEEIANKIRQWDTSRIKSPEQVLQTPKEQPSANRQRQARPSGKRMSQKEWREFNRR